MYSISLSLVFSYNQIVLKQIKEMASPYPSHMLSSPSTNVQSLSKIVLKPSNFLIPRFKGCSWYNTAHIDYISSKPKRVFQNIGPNKLCAMNMAAGQSDDPGKISLDHIMDKARKYWDKCPQPVKIFPWNKALENFIQLTVDLTLAVVKYLCIPLLAVSSLSEMSYCAQERKLFFTPVPLLLGVVVAVILRETVLEVSPLLKEKDAEVPWHLIAIAIFFTVLKLPGPYYPYWGRIFIPHFANGGLWRTLWDVYLWYRRTHKALDTTLPHNSMTSTLPDSNKI